MKTALLFFAVLALGCASVQPRTFSDGQARRNMDVMKQCAELVSKYALILSEDEQNWHYQQCLFENEATI